MFDIPLPLANAVYNTANVFVIIGAVLVAIGTIAAIWSGGVKERFADERISQNEADTSRANADAATANERAASLENEAEQARLETERLKQQFAWRRLNETQFRTMVDNLSGLDLKLTLSAISVDPESMLFATDIQRALVAAGFNLQIRSTMPFGRGPIVGIIISGPKIDILSVGQAFRLAGFDIKGRERQGDIEIFIGSKPPPQ